MNEIKDFQLLFASNLKRYMEKYNKSLTDISKALGVSKSAVSFWLNGQKSPRMDKVDKLCELFHCKRSDLLDDSRTRFITTNTYQATGIIKVFDGMPCGDPRTIVDDVIDYQPTFLPNPADYFAVIVHGDSMVNAGIEDGDEVMFHIQSYAENGDIVACRVNDDECTLKRFKQQGSTVVLMPENPAHDPIIVPAADFEGGEAQIMGKAIKVSKRL